MVIYNNIMGKRGPQSKFTDVACPNKACKDYGITGHGNISAVHLYTVDVLKHLNVSSSLKVHFASEILASLAGVFLHLTSLSS